jgi:diguanylate cyclase (GGDEF)-like protein/PAS domain S-box-containing protein
MNAGGGSENEQLLELLYLCPAAIVKFNGLGAIDMMTPAGVQLLMPLASGAALDNIFSLFSFVAPELREMVGRFEGRAGRICDEYRILASVGSRVNMRALMLSVTVQKVEDDAFVAVIADVTAAAVREDLIRMNEARLRATFDGVRDYSICTVDPAGHITSWNRSAERLDGYRADEVIGVSADVLMATSGVAPVSFTRYYATAREAGFHQFEGWRVAKDGHRYWASVAISPLRLNDDDDDIIGYSIITRDITEHKRTEDALQNLVITDPLTGALNRRGLFEAALREEARLKSGSGTMALLMIDVDHFKETNDTHGHAVGDIVLKQIVQRIRAETRAVDIIGRYGGEEFAVLLPGSDAAGAAVVAERIRERVASSPMVFLNGSAAASVSIGVAHTAAGVKDIANLVSLADAAMYAAKKAGRNRVTLS